MIRLIKRSDGYYYTWPRVRFTWSPSRRDAWRFVGQDAAKQCREMAKSLGAKVWRIKHSRKRRSTGILARKSYTHKT